jgi:heterodisulfide reductase subunit A-like polyferredoxin
MTSSGYVARVDRERCAGCARCQAACAFNAIRVDGRAAVRGESCLGCGVCVGQCENGAVSLVLDPRRGISLDVARLMADG